MAPKASENLTRHGAESTMDAMPSRLPRRRTLARWHRLALSQHSLLRTLEYEAIAGLRLRGLTLDVGGGNKNTYHNLLHIEGRIETINIDPSVAPTHVLDLNEPLPLSDGTYDNVISLNTFEHILDDRMAISESLRVLRPGGEFHFLVPFLFKVHGAPFDYHRHTAQWWERFLIGLGVRPEELCIEPLVWDARSTAHSLRGLRGGVRRALLLLLAFVTPVYWARMLVASAPYLRTRPWRSRAAPLSTEERTRTHYEEARAELLRSWLLHPREAFRGCSRQHLKTRGNALRSCAVARVVVDSRRWAGAVRTANHQTGRSCSTRFRSSVAACKGAPCLLG